jgi:hypothetical protein
MSDEHYNALIEDEDRRRERDEDEITAIKTAVFFHDTYERLAPSFGYETRTDTRAFDPKSPNGKLMIAVCRQLGEGDLVCKLRALNEDKHRTIQAYCKAASEDKAMIRKMKDALENLLHPLRCPKFRDGEDPFWLVNAKAALKKAKEKYI